MSGNDHRGGGKAQSFLDHLGQRRVGVRGARQVFAGRPELDGGDGFGDQIACPRADDVNAEDAVVLLVGEDLHEAVGGEVRLGVQGFAREPDLTGPQFR